MANVPKWIGGWMMIVVARKMPPRKNRGAVVLCASPPPRRDSMELSLINTRMLDEYSVQFSLEFESGIIWKAWKNMNDVIDDPQLGYNFPFVLSVNLSTNLSIV